MTTVNIKILPRQTCTNESYGSLLMLIVSKIDYLKKIMSTCSTECCTKVKGNTNTCPSC